MNILVTGANGFLGIHVVHGLLKNGYQVTAMIHQKNEVLQGTGARIVQASLLDYSSLQKAAEGIDCIVHVAGAMSSSSKDRERLFKINVGGVKNILKLVEEKKIKLIHISSCVAVGANNTASDPLLNETSVNATIGRNFANYDSKRMGEELVLEAARAGRISAVVLNPGLIYGAGDVRKPIRKGNIKAAEGKLPFYTGGGVNIIHVDDVVAAILSSIEKGKSGERYLITGDNITIRELLSSISEAAGAKPPGHLLPTKVLKGIAFVHDLLRLKGELSRESIFSATAFHWYDNAKAVRDLGLKPRSYKDAIKDSVDWMKKNHYLDS